MERGAAVLFVKGSTVEKGGALKRGENQIFIALKAGQKRRKWRGVQSALKCGDAKKEEPKTPIWMAEFGGGEAAWFVRTSG